ncbi:MAG: hypothetical protein ACX931_17160 [Saccharospirillum sp.]
MKDFSHTPIVDLTSIVANHLEARGIDVVLVGGLAVEIYTSNRYLTQDIDMVDISSSRATILSKALSELGFYKFGRVYRNDTTDISLEFPPGPLAVGSSLIDLSTVTRVNNGSIPILSVTDVVKDRLAAFVHWQDHQSLVQAVAMMLHHELAAESFEAFLENEGGAELYSTLKKLYQASLLGKTTSMEEIEAKLTSILLDMI